MKIYPVLIVTMMASLSFLSCSKDDTKAPVISISTPVDGQVVKQNSTFAVKGTVTDDNELKEIEVAGNKITSFTSKTSHTIDLNLKVENIPVGPINLDISAIDKSGNKSTKQITIKVE